MFTCPVDTRAAHPLAVEPRVYSYTLQANRLERLPNGALCARSYDRVIIISRTNGPAHPICGLGPLQDRPACPVLPNEPSGPKRKICGGIDADFLTEGEGGAGLAIARHR